MVNRWAACPLPCTEQVQCGAVVVYNALTQKRWEVNASQETLFSDPSIYSWKERQLFSSIKKTVEESQRKKEICQKLKKISTKDSKSNRNSVNWSLKICVLRLGLWHIYILSFESKKKKFQKSTGMDFLFWQFCKIYFFIRLKTFTIYKYVILIKVYFFNCWWN